MGVGGQRHAPAALPPGMTRYPLYRRPGGPPAAGLDGCGKSRPLPGFDLRIIRRLASHCTDWAIPANMSVGYCNIWMNHLLFSSVVSCSNKSGGTNYPKMYESNKISRRQKGDIKQVACWGLTHIRRHQIKFCRPGDLATGIYEPWHK
jgi:hypothetical protein